MLCGVAHKTSVALQDLEYVTLRWVCPVSCGCTSDFSDECPRSCKDGDRTSVDFCSKGLCAKDTQILNPRQVVPFEAGSKECELIDWQMRGPSAGGLSQQQCEQHLEEYSTTCCKEAVLLKCRQVFGNPGRAPNLLPVYSEASRRRGMLTGRGTPGTCGQWDQELCDPDLQTLWREYCPYPYCSKCDNASQGSR